MILADFRIKWLAGILTLRYFKANVRWNLRRISWKNTGDMRKLPPFGSENRASQNPVHVQTNPSVTTSAVIFQWGQSHCVFPVRLLDLVDRLEKSQILRESNQNDPPFPINRSSIHKKKEQNLIFEVFQSFLRDFPRRPAAPRLLQKVFIHLVEEILESLAGIGNPPKR